MSTDPKVHVGTLADIIEVTRDDIIKGLPADSEACAVAIAARRTWPHIERIEVSGEEIYLTAHSGGLVLRGDDGFGDWIASFDGGCNAHPTRFKVDWEKSTVGLA